MNAKEISEIKKTIRPNTGVVQKISCFHVSPDKQITKVSVPSVYQLSEDDFNHYGKVLKKCFSGTDGKNLNTMEFPNEAELAGHIQEILMKARADDDTACEEICTKISENFYSSDAFCVIFMHGKYDIPTKNSDDSEGESSEIYNFMVGCICTVNQMNTTLAYDYASNSLSESPAIRAVKAPEFGFVFPAFNDRTSDIHSFLMYTKKSDGSCDDLVSNVFECRPSLTSEEEVQTFTQIVESAFNGSCEFDEATNIQMSLASYAQAQAENGNSGDLTLDKAKLEEIMEENYAPDMESFSEECENLLDGKVLHVPSLMNVKKGVIKAGNITISVPMDEMTLISMQDVNGVKCICIKPNGNDVTVNGMATVQKN